MLKTLAAVLTAVFALTLSSCGNGDDDKASKNISTSLMDSQKKQSSGTGQFFKLKKKEADCIGSGLVDKIGTDQLQQYGVLNKDLETKKDVTNAKMSTGDAKAATNVLFGCTDVSGKVQQAVDKTGQIPTSLKGCVHKALSDATLRPMFEKVFAGKAQEATQGLLQAMSKCGLGSGG